MQNLCFKDRGGALQNLVTHTAPSPCVPWWNAIGSQSNYREPLTQLKPLSVGQTNGDSQLSATSKQEQETNQGLNLVISEKESYGAAKFSMFTGQNNGTVKGQKAQQLPSTISLQSSPPEGQARFELGLSQPLVCASYPYMDQCYGLFSTYGAQATHGRVLLPLSVTEDGPIYVNAKQYHGILRRRQSRAKAELENKAIKARKPYLHESRHLHAMRRARGCGGRFLNTKKNNAKGGSNKYKANGAGGTQAAGSPSSEALESDSGNTSSAKDAYGSSSISGTEVTSMYSRGDINHFQIEHLRPAFQPHSNVVDGGQTIGLATKWVAADGRCDFLKV